VELVPNKGCLGEYGTAFDGEMEEIADIMDYVNDNQIPGDLTIHSVAQAAIARVSHTRIGPGQDGAIRVVTAVQHRNERGWRTRIEWVPGHFGIGGNERADQLAGEAAAEKKKGRTLIAWLKERISLHYSMAKDTETETGKESILFIYFIFYLFKFIVLMQPFGYERPTPNLILADNIHSDTQAERVDPTTSPQKSFLDCAPNRVARTIAQIRQVIGCVHPT
jgi:hypothetical protein